MLQTRDGLTAREIAAVWPAVTLMPPLPIPEILPAEPRPSAVVGLRERRRTLWCILVRFLKPRGWKRRNAEQATGR